MDGVVVEKAQFGCAAPVRRLPSRGQLPKTKRKYPKEFWIIVNIGWRCFRVAARVAPRSYPALILIWDTMCVRVSSLAPRDTFLGFLFSYLNRRIRKYEDAELDMSRGADITIYACEFFDA